MAVEVGAVAMHDLQQDERGRDHDNGEPRCFGELGGQDARSVLARDVLG